MSRLRWQRKKVKHNDTSDNDTSENDASRRRVCIACGNELFAGARFCVICGARVDGGHEQFSSSPEDRSSDQQQPGKPLTEDVRLNFTSISALHGHFGESTDYKHADRVVVYNKWGSSGADKTETLDIPSEIRTEEELRTYVRRTRPHWLPLDMHHRIR